MAVAALDQDLITPTGPRFSQGLRSVHNLKRPGQQVEVLGRPCRGASFSPDPPTRAERSATMTTLADEDTAVVERPVVEAVRYLAELSGAVAGPTPQIFKSWA